MNQVGKELVIDINRSLEKLVVNFRDYAFVDELETWLEVDNITEKLWLRLDAESSNPGSQEACGFMRSKTGL
ncbi:hypothetical protein CFP56_036175 [Quercus suber]|uniref:Uncharacterized protein n=1 Tax=Quercus suber TaxID=58331 RepID=A0AAW0J7R7_QUESU